MAEPTHHGILGALAGVDPFDHRSAREELRQLFDGDMLFFRPDEGGDGGEGDGGGSDGGDGSSDGAQGGDGGESQEDNGGSPGGAGDDDETLTKEAARKLRSEHQTLRQRLKAAEEKLSERERADLSEQEKLQRDRDAAASENNTLKEKLSTATARLAALDAGVHPQRTGAALGLLDRSELEDADDEQALVKAFKALKKDHSYLFTSKDVDAGRRGGSTDDVEPSPGHGRLAAAYANNDR